MAKTFDEAIKDLLGQDIFEQEISDVKGILKSMKKNKATDEQQQALQSGQVMSKKPKTKDKDNAEEVENAYWEDLGNFIIDKWKKNGTVTDEERTRDYLDAMLFLISGYRFNCVIKTLCEVDDLIEQFNEKHLADSQRKV